MAEGVFSNKYIGVRSRRKKGGNMVSLRVNGKKYTVDVPKDVPLLWVLPDHHKLTGTKYACGVGECGNCTVHIDGKAQRSCASPSETRRESG